MVRGFGVLLVIGIAVAFMCALTAGVAALSGRLRVPGPVQAARGALGPATRGAGELLRENAAARWVRGHGERAG